MDVLWKKHVTDFGVSLQKIDETGADLWVPEAPGNRHYEEYLEWLAEGNTPEIINEVE